MRKASVELARLSACLIVIGVHVCLANTINGSYDSSRLLISCFLADGVAVFWLISGFFLFQNTRYDKLLRKTIRQIAVPMIIFMLFCFYFSEWIIDKQSLIESLYHSVDEYINIVKSVLSWEIAVYYCGHLWYLLIYILLIVIYPVLKAFVDVMGNNKKIQKGFMLVTAGLLLYNDLSGNSMAQFSHHAFNAVIPAAIYVIWGQILYQYRSKFNKKRYFVIAGGAFIGVNILRTIILLLRQGRGISYYNVLYWYSFMGLACALCIIIASFSVVDDDKKCRLNQVICTLASYTFTVYLVHMPVIVLLERRGMQEMLLGNIVNGNDTIITESIYTIIMIIIVFSISMIISVFIRKIAKFFLQMYRKSDKCIENKY